MSLWTCVRREQPRVQLQLHAALDGDAGLHSLQHDVADGHAQALVRVGDALQYRGAEGAQDCQGLQPVVLEAVPVHHGVLVHVPALAPFLDDDLDSLPLSQGHLRVRERELLPLERLPPHGGQLDVDGGRQHDQDHVGYGVRHQLLVALTQDRDAPLRAARPLEEQVDQGVCLQCRGHHASLRGTFMGRTLWQSESVFWACCCGNGGADGSPYPDG